MSTTIWAPAARRQPRCGEELAAWEGADRARGAGEVQKVMAVMHRHGFHIDCVYNQQTEEVPQLFFSHQLKVGDAYALAEQVRRGLDQTDSA